MGFKGSLVQIQSLRQLEWGLFQSPFLFIRNSGDRLRYDVLIPAFNARESLPKLIREIQDLPVRPAHIFIVDDGSTDGTAETIAHLSVQIVRQKKNKGKGAALIAGFSFFREQSDAHVLICLDSDGQHPPAFIPDFLDKCNNESCMVIGNRRKIGVRMPFHRILSNSITSIIVTLVTGQKIPDSQCGFRLIHRDIVPVFNGVREQGFQAETEMILLAARAGIQIRSVPIPTVYDGQKSYIRHIGDTLRFIKIVLIRGILQR
jgi:glycosyltransferase involved in cell wall biosynthesis